TFDRIAIKGGNARGGCRHGGFFSEKNGRVQQNGPESGVNFDSRQGLPRSTGNTYFSREFGYPRRAFGTVRIGQGGDMNFEKYTERSRGFIQSAQSLALREGHQQFTTEHLLKVLLDDPEGLAAGLIDRSGGRSREALKAVETALGKMS